MIKRGQGIAYQLATIAVVVAFVVIMVVFRK
jgi:hypothetical protein